MGLVHVKEIVRAVWYNERLHLSAPLCGAAGETQRVRPPTNGVRNSYEASRPMGLVTRSVAADEPRSEPHTRVLEIHGSFPCPRGTVMNDRVCTS
jgi:hypothetical protein